MQSIHRRPARHILQDLLEPGSAAFAKPTARQGIRGALSFEDIKDHLEAALAKMV